MKLDLGKVSYEGRLFEFGEAKLKIRPYPASRTDVAFKDGAVIFSGDAAFDMFAYCLETWEGVEDAKGKPLALTPAVKKQVYDFRIGRAVTPDGKEETLADFVLRTAREMTAAIEADTKN